MSITSSYATTIEDYEAVASNYNIVELIEGDIIVTPPPTVKHQQIIRDLTIILEKLIGDVGEILFSPIGVKTLNNEVFEPDIIFIGQERQNIIRDQYIEGSPHLIIEVLSPSTAHRDKKIKKLKYFELGVTEYWLVDPKTDTIEIFDRKEDGFILFKTWNYLQEEIISPNFEKIRFNYKRQVNE